MADRLGEGFIEIFALDDKFNASMRQVQAELARTSRMADQAKAKLGLAGGGGGGGGGGVVGGGGGMLKGMLGTMLAYKAASVATGEVMDSISRGSGMIETMQKTRVVFGAATASVTNMADMMAAKFGSNKATMLDAASQFGLIGQAAKLSEAESAKMATTMTMLAADASSFYNVPLDVALQKIQAGLVGQSRPLREFGVLINIATVNAKAAEMGFKALNGQFSESEKVMARMQLIAEGLSKATGDLGRTQDSPANVARKVEGMWENFKTDVGTPIAAAGAVMASAGLDAAQKSIKEHGYMGTYLGAGTVDIGKAIVKAAWDQGRADKVMGVGSDEMKKPILTRETPMEKFFRERQKYDQFMSDKYMKENAFKGGGFGAFGMMGNIGLMMANESMTEDIDKKIKQKQADFDQWGGGHVTDPLSFARAAQEKILTPMDSTAKEQLDELKAIRAVLEQGEASGGGAILRGREN